MNSESRRILDLLAQGKITVDEAAQLLEAVRARTDNEPGEPDRADASTGSKAPRFFRISVMKNAQGKTPDKRVDIRVPIALLRGGMRLSGLVPGFVNEKVQRKLRERGIDVDLSRLDDKALDDVLQSLSDVVVDINEGEDHVRIVQE